MLPKSPNHLKNILHPYVFVLKEGGKIKKDFLDYSLMILMVNSTEVIGSSSETREVRIDFEKYPF